MLRMFDGCKDVLDTDQDGSSILAPFCANGAHPSSIAMIISHYNPLWAIALYVVKKVESYTDANAVRCQSTIHYLIP